MVAKERRGEVQDSGWHRGNRGTQHGLTDWKAVNNGMGDTFELRYSHYPHVLRAGYITTLSVLFFTGKMGMKYPHSAGLFQGAEETLVKLLPQQAQGTRGARDTGVETGTEEDKAPVSPVCRSGTWLLVGKNQPTGVYEHLCRGL